MSISRIFGCADKKTSMKKKLWTLVVVTFLIGIPVFAIANPQFSDSLPVTATQETAVESVATAAEGNAISRSGGAYVTQLSSGQFHNLALRSDGTIWGWGSNWAGEMGQGYRFASYFDPAVGGATAFLTPTQIGSASNWVYVSAHGMMSFAINEAGELWGWGSNNNRSLGIDLADQHVLTPTRIGTANNWVSVTGSDMGTVGIQADGTLWTWGNLPNGRPDVSWSIEPVQEGTLSTNWVSAASGGSHASGHVLAIQADGTLWGWGVNSANQLGDLPGTGISNYVNIPTQIGTSNQWAQVSAGYMAQSMGIKADGTLWSWGLGGPWHGQTQPFNNITEPTQLGDSNQWAHIEIENRHAMGVKTDGTLWTWGDGSSGRLGHNNETTLSTPTQVGDRTDWAFPSSAWDTSQALTADGVIYTWGSNTELWGALGKGVTHGGQGFNNGTNNWIPWRLAASCMSTSRTNWTVPANATTPNHNAQNVPMNTPNVVINFDRPMRPGSDYLGTIVIDNGATVNVAAGTWSDSARGPNTVFTAPLTLVAEDTIHIATVSGFVDAQFGQRGANEMHDHTWVFRTGELADLDDFLTKNLRKPEGTNLLSDKTFTFNFARYSFNGGTTTADVDRIPQIPNRNITITNAMVPDTAAGISTRSASINPLESITFTEAGIFTWVVTEAVNSSGTTAPSNVVYSPAVYEMNVWVVHDTENNVFDIEYIEIIPRTVDNDSQTVGTKVDYLEFLNTYTRSTSGTSAHPGAVSASKVVTGAFAPEGILFDFDVTLTRTALCPTNSSFVGRIYNADGSFASTFNIVSGTSTHFQMADGQRVVFGDPRFADAGTLLVGTDITVAERAIADFVSSVELHIGGVSVPITPNTQPDTAISTGERRVIDGRNTAVFTNVHQHILPTGLSVTSGLSVALPIMAIAIFAASTFAVRHRKAIEELPPTL